jgi:hypothetical protein
VNKAERSEAHWSADAYTWNKTERAGTDPNPFTALWTTVSGFESLPPSQTSLATRASSRQAESHFSEESFSEASPTGEVCLAVAPSGSAERRRTTFSVESRGLHAKSNWPKKRTPSRHAIVPACMESASDSSTSFEANPIPCATTSALRPILVSASTGTMKAPTAIHAHTGSGRSPFPSSSRRKRRRFDSSAISSPDRDVRSRSATPRQHRDLIDLPHPRDFGASAWDLFNELYERIQRELAIRHVEQGELDWRITDAPHLVGRITWDPEPSARECDVRAGGRRRNISRRVDVATQLRHVARGDVHLSASENLLYPTGGRPLTGGASHAARTGATPASRRRRR